MLHLPSFIFVVLSSLSCQMRSIRIGKDLQLEWKILTNGEPLSLEGRDIYLQLIDPRGRALDMDFTVSGNTLSFSYPGVAQKFTGVYRLTVWENHGKERQTVYDNIKAFKLVPTTDLEKDE